MTTKIKNSDERRYQPSPYNEPTKSLQELQVFMQLIPHVPPARNCQWPLDNKPGKRPRFLMCEKPLKEEGKPYCEEHAKIAYTKWVRSEKPFVFKQVING